MAVAAGSAASPSRSARETSAQSLSHSARTITHAVGLTLSRRAGTQKVTLERRGRLCGHARSRKLRRLETPGHARSAVVPAVAARDHALLRFNAGEAGVDSFARQLSGAGLRLADRLIAPSEVGIRRSVIKAGPTALADAPRHPREARVDAA